MDWRNGKGALYVVAHAKWQQSRGRNPSEPYGEHRNPRKALSAALAELRTYQPMCGGYIPSMIEAMVEVARFTNQDVSGCFNDAKVTAAPSSDVAALVAFWRSETDRQREGLRNSPQGKKAALKRARQLAARRKRYAELMTELPNLDFSNLGLLLNWFHDFEDAGGDVESHPTEDDYVRIIATFEAHSYKVDENTGPYFNGDDADNCARYIIGQCLSCLHSRYPVLQLLPSWVVEWRQKFQPPPEGISLH